MQCGKWGNCRLEIDPAGDATFTRLTLKAKAGAFSLEGGSDEATPATATTPATYVPPTTFELVSFVDEVLDCETNFTSANENATVDYLGNADGSKCGEFGVTLTSGDKEVIFLKPLSLNPSAQFIFDVTWKQAGGPAVEIPTVTIDFENPSGVKVDDMGFCPEILYSEVELVGVQGDGDT